MNVTIRDESTGTWVLNSWEFECQHDHVTLERRELDISSWDVAVCDDCDEELN